MIFSIIYLKIKTIQIRFVEVSDAEFILNIKPTKQLSLGGTYSGMVSKTADGAYTPFIPAQKISPKIHYQMNKFNHLPENNPIPGNIDELRAFIKTFYLKKKIFYR